MMVFMDPVFIVNWGTTVQVHGMRGDKMVIDWN